MITYNDLELLKAKYPNNLDDILKKVEDNYPIQYLIGDVNFYGYTIKVDERVLIPRFETELLTKKTIDYIKKYNIKPNIIDICTGSGCIAITLSKELNISLDAIDISSDAISLAKENAKLNNSNINFITCDIKEFNADKKYNVIISNPPYVKEDEEVDIKTKYEPQNALFASDNGLEFYKIILDKSKTMLEKKSIIAFEIGCTEAQDIKDYATKLYPDSMILIEKDLNNLDRYVFIINE